MNAVDWVMSRMKEPSSYAAGALGFVLKEKGVI